MRLDGRETSGITSESQRPWGQDADGDGRGTKEKRFCGNRGKERNEDKEKKGGGRAWLTPLSDEQQHGHAHVINKRQVTPPGEYGVPEHDTVLNMELAGEHQPHPPAETANNRCHETQEGSKPVLLQSSETYAHAI